ncbi:MAG TPA: zinc-binding dehydrogenase [Rhizomicrobium sp.]|nr:zinc-binding dehydrogenase [Rhizomicrobium sp.]
MIDATIKAFRAHRLVGLEALAVDDAPRPEPGLGEVAVAIEAAGIQLADLAAISGSRRPVPQLPFTPGLEGAGIVTAVGADVTSLAAGDRVCAFFPRGSLAECAVTAAELAVPLPKQLSAQTAAALPFAYAGALMSLRGKARLARGETLLVLGAGGLAGLAAVEIGKALGARVIAAASGEERAAGAIASGADHTVDTTAAPLSESVNALTGGKGADVIFDPVGGDAFQAALGAGRIGARLIVAGFAGGKPGELKTGLLYARDMQLIAGNTLLSLTENPLRAQAALATVVEWAADGKIEPRIAAKFALKDARHAFDYVRSHRGSGAVVVTMG